jgi:hypothetical protein
MEWAILRQVLVSKLKLLKLAKYFMYMAPIYGITHKIYVAFFGSYDIDWGNTERLIKYSSGVTLFVFFALILFAHFIEKTALPFLLSIIPPVPIERDIRIRSYVVIKRAITNFRVKKIK